MKTILPSLPTGNRRGIWRGRKPTCDVGGADEELGTVVGEEGLVAAALLLAQHIQLRLKAAACVHAAGLAEHLPAHNSTVKPEIITQQLSLLSQLHKSKQLSYLANHMLPQPKQSGLCVRSHDWNQLGASHCMPSFSIEKNPHKV